MVLPSIIDSVGHYGPTITFGMTFYCLLERTPYLMVFFSGSILNVFLNKTLKVLFKEPRPRGQIPFIDHNDLTGVEQYGFPSGHAQMSFFALAFLYFVEGPLVVLYIMSFFCFLTLYQRWKYRRHSVKQLVFGSFFGILFAYILVYMTKNFLDGHKTYNIIPL
jgi:membrane-associated phospholipid phosphatase